MARAAMSAAMPKVSTRRCLVSGCWLAGQLSRSHINGRVAGGRPSLQLSSTSWPRTVASRKVGIIVSLRLADQCLLCDRIIAEIARTAPARAAALAGARICGHGGGEL